MSDQVVEKQPRPELSELGTTGLRVSGGRVLRDEIRKLRGSQKHKTYERMAEFDPTVGGLLFAVEFLLKQVPWEVEPGEPGPGSVEAAEFLGTILDDMSMSWRQFVGEWMAAVVHGFAPFEVVYKIRGGPGRDPRRRSRYADGRVGVRKLAIRHPTTLRRWVFGDDGGLEAMVQFAQFGEGAFREVAIPIEKLLIFALMQRQGSPEGSSLLRRAFIPWYRKDNIEQIESIGIERDLAGMPRAYVPPQWMSPDASDNQAQAVEDLKKACRDLRTGDQSYIVLPAIFDDDGNRLLDFDLVSTAGRRTIDTSAPKDYYSRQILMSALADLLMLGHERVGSFALADSKTDMFMIGLGGLLDEKQDVLNRHLVPRLMRLNGFPTDERMPEWRHGDVETRNLEQLGEYLERLARAGHPLFPSEDGALEQEVLRAANLPTTGVGVDMGDEPLSGNGARPTAGDANAEAGAMRGGRRRATRAGG